MTERLPPAAEPRRRGGGMLGAILHTSAVNVLIMVLGMLSSIVTARWFGVEGKGEFSAILYWPTLLAGLLGFGLPTSLIYNAKTNPGRSGDYATAGLVFQLPVGLLAGAVAWLCLPGWMGNFSEQVVAIARWYAVSAVPLLLAINLLAALAQSADNFTLYNGLRLYVPLSNVLGLCALWATGRLSLQTGAAVFLGTSAAVVGWALFRLRRRFAVRRLKSLADRAVVRPLFGYGGKVFGVELLGTLYAQFDKLVILSLLTPRDFGLYTVVYTLSRAFNAVQTAISNVLFPKVTGLGKEHIVATVCRAFRLSFLFMAAAAVPGVFAGRFLLGLLFGEPFLEASGAFYLLAAECIIGGSSWILASAFNAMGRPGLVTVRQAIALAVTIAFIFILTPAFGLNGIALALLIGAIVRLAVSVAALKLAFRVRVADIVYGKGDARFLFARVARAVHKVQTM